MAPPQYGTASSIPRTGRGCSGRLEDHLAGRTDTLDVEARLQARNGEWHWIVERGRVVERAADGRPARMVGAVADITERKHAVQALAASERRFRAMFDGGVQIKTLLDLDCTVLEANRVRTRFCRRRPRAGCGVQIMWETPSWAGSPVRVERLRKACDEAREGKIVQYQEELEGPDGRRATIDFSIKPILGDEGQVIQLLAEGRDITERKQVEDTMRELESIASMGRLAARVAHEINNPLAGIQNSFLLVKDSIPESHPYFRYVGAIEREIGRIAGITRQLYETYRPEPDGDAASASVSTIIADAVAMIQQINRSSGVTIEVDTTGCPGIVGVPAGLLRQAIYNLVQNAIDASPPGGCVAVRAWKENQSFLLTVADAGPGVPPEMRERIFEPFVTSKVGHPQQWHGPRAWRSSGVLSWHWEDRPRLPMRLAVGQCSPSASRSGPTSNNEPGERSHHGTLRAFCSPMMKPRSSPPQPTCSGARAITATKWPTVPRRWRA